MEFENGQDIETVHGISGKIVNIRDDGRIEFIGQSEGILRMCKGKPFMVTYIIYPENIISVSGVKIDNPKVEETNQ